MRGSLASLPWPGRGESDQDAEAQGVQSCMLSNCGGAQQAAAKHPAGPAMHLAGGRWAGQALPRVVRPGSHLNGTLRAGEIPECPIKCARCAGLFEFLLPAKPESPLQTPMEVTCTGGLPQDTEGNAGEAEVCTGVSGQSRKAREKGIPESQGGCCSGLAHSWLC